MSKIPENIDFELALIWLKKQNLDGVSPAKVKELFFKAVQEIERTDVERWD